MNHCWITGIVTPELPLEQLNGNGHEDVFLNGDCDNGMFMTAAVIIYAVYSYRP